MSKERNIIIYDKAYEYLNNEIKPPEVELTKYFLCDEWKTLEDVYIRFIASAQNYQMMPNVIKFYKREQEIKGILQDCLLSQLYTTKKNVTILST